MWHSTPPKNCFRLISSRALRTKTCTQPRCLTCSLSPTKPSMSKPSAWRSCTANSTAWMCLCSTKRRFSTSFRVATTMLWPIGCCAKCSMTATPTTTVSSICCYLGMAVSTTVGFPPASKTLSSFMKQTTAMTKTAVGQPTISLVSSTTIQATACRRPS